MQVTIPYGSTGFDTVLPDQTELLSITEPEPVLSKEVFRNKVATFLATHKCDLTQTIIVVADKTRLCGYEIYLKELVYVLLEHGLDSSKVQFLIAYGTHPRQSDEECVDCYGSIYHQFPFLHHSCQGKELFVDLGKTQRGTPVRLRRDLLEASCLITMGPICHHYFAGYGGGRKLIFPGCGEKEAIYANHGLFLNQHLETLEPHCQPGIIQDNPLARDLYDIDEYRGADLAIHGIMDSHGTLCDVIVGNTRQAHTSACTIHAQHCEISSSGFPLVIASCGGFPKDINFIQSHKAIHNSAMFVEDGGTLVIYSECRDQIGSTTFLPWFEHDSFAAAFAALNKDYQGNGGTALALMTKCQRITICMVTSIDEKTCRKIGVKRYDHRDTLNLIKMHRHPLAYIPNASLLVRKSSTEESMATL